MRLLVLSFCSLKVRAKLFESVSVHGGGGKSSPVGHQCREKLDVEQGFGDHIFKYDPIEAKQRPFA